MLFALCAIINLSLSRRGHSVKEEALEPDDFLTRPPWSVQSCSKSELKRSLGISGPERRAEWFSALSEKRDMPTVSKRGDDGDNISHLDLVKSNESTECLAQPEAIAGPHHVDGQPHKPTDQDRT